METELIDDFLTIEKKLKQWGNYPEYEALWHGWHQNKRWLTQLLELTLPSFPTYSKHDASHCQSILQNMERILGKANIQKLTATDCFMLLHVAYIHDISMALTADDRLEIALSDEFLEMLLQIADGSDSVMQKYAKILLNKFESDIAFKIKHEKMSDREKTEYLKEILKFDTEIFTGVVLLFGEFERRRHGINSGNKLRDLIKDYNKLGSGFSVSGIPMRIFYRVADCAELHTNWNYHDILKLPYEDTGYGLDSMHPRFVAVMLQLGDALDMDNNRFHLFTKDYIGTVTEESQKHFDKHGSIRSLQISPTELLIEADCPTLDSLRLIRNECDNLEKLLEFASYHWSDICPKELLGCLPTLKPAKLLFKGKEIPSDLVNAKFNISQNKAFNLIEGSNVYNCSFPFIRELLQNAIDATKLQYWTDIVHESRLTTEEIKLLQNKKIYELKKYKSPLHYPIRFEFKFRKKDQMNNLVKLKDSDFNLDISNENVGIQMNIIDYGTGISDKNILDISNVGSGFNKQKKLLQYMPEWLMPTSEFGIGLQSIFLVSNIFKVKTHTREGHCYDIYFTSVTRNGKGYINVEPINTSYDNYRPYGSDFEIFIPNSQRMQHNECIESWQGRDPFSDNFKKYKVLRHSNELLQQILISLNDMIGDTIFPIEVYIENQEFEGYVFKNNISMENLKFSFIDRNTTNSENIKSNINWLLNLENKNGDLSKKIYANDNYYQVVFKNDNIYVFDYDNIELYIWNSNISSCAKVNAKNIFNKMNFDSDNVETTIYYKGIFTEKRIFEPISNIIEYIDIKGRINKECLQLNRSGFTKIGKKYIHDVVYNQINQSIFDALNYFFVSKEDNKTEHKEDNKTEHKEDNKTEHKEDNKTEHKEDNKTEHKEDDKTELLKNVTARYNKKLNEIEQLIDKNKDLELLSSKINSLALCLFNLSFFVLFHNINLKVKNRKKQYKNEEAILDEIAELYKKTNEKLGNHSIKFKRLLEIDVINLSDMGPNNLSFEKKTELFFEIFRVKNKYGVYSKRIYEKNWQHFLLKFSNLIPSEKDNYDFITTEDGFNKISDILNRTDVFDRLSDIFISSSDRITISVNRMDKKENFFPQWLLNVIPTVAIGCDETSDQRINILGLTDHNFIIQNDIIKFKTFERMIQKVNANNISRFSTVTWENFEDLTIKNLNQPSILFVSRGKISSSHRPQFIIPITGDSMLKLYNAWEYDFNQYINYVDEMSDLINSNFTDKQDDKLLQPISFYVMGRILENLNQGEYREIKSNDAKKIIGDFLNYLKDCCEELEENKNENEALNDFQKIFDFENKIVLKFKELLSSLYCLDFRTYSEKLENGMLKQSIDSIKEDDFFSDSFNRLVDFVLINNDEVLERDEIIQIYNLFFDKLVDILYSRNVHNLKNTIIRTKVKNLNII